MGARSLTISGNIVRIPLTRGREAIADASDLPLLAGRNWHFLKWSGGGIGWGASRVQVKECGRRVRQRITMHRFLMNAQPGDQVDHINHDTLDNRRANLRIANPSQNQANRLKLAGCSSKFKGVSFEAQTQKWRAGVWFAENGRRKSIRSKRVTSEIAAAHIYDEYATRIFGDYAMTNKKLGLFQGGV